MEYLLVGAFAGIIATHLFYRAKLRRWRHAARYQADAAALAGLRAAGAEKDADQLRRALLRRDKEISLMGDNLARLRRQIAVMRGEHVEG